MNPYTFTETLEYLPERRMVCVKRAQTSSSRPEILSHYYALQEHQIGPMQASELPLGQPVEARDDAVGGGRGTIGATGNLDTFMVLSYRFITPSNRIRAPKCARVPTDLGLEAQ